MNQNLFVGIGRCAGVPQLKTYKNAAGEEGFRCWFKLAITRLMDRGKERSDQRASFISIVVWGEAAKRHAQYIGKGDALCVTGELICESQKQNDGSFVDYTSINARDIQYLGQATKNMGPEALGRRAAGIQERLSVIQAELEAVTGNPDTKPETTPASDAPAHTETAGGNPFTPDGDAPGAAATA